MSQPNDEALEVLTSVPHELEGGMIVAALERAGIRARASGALTAGFRAEAPGRVQILVRSADRVAATAVLADIKARDQEVDWSQIDVGLPE